MSSRKIRYKKSDGSIVTEKFSFNKNKKYKFNKSTGAVEEFTGTPAEDEITIPGSKSSLRRLAEVERNISILASKSGVAGQSNADTDTVLKTGSHTLTGNYRFEVDSTSQIESAGSSSRFPIEIYAPANTDAAITFHVHNDYAGYLGLDYQSNDLFWGGWSVGASTKHRIWHAGNDGSGSGLDADLLDGIQASKFVRNDVNTQTIARHLDANTSWGGGLSLFLGWNNGKTIIGNNNHSVHDTASGYGQDSVILGNPTYAHSTLTVNSTQRINGHMTAWNQTTPGTAVGSLHIGEQSSTTHAGPAITFGARDASNGNNAQAGIYINSDGSYGTKMTLATTNSYATGSKGSVKIDHVGNMVVTGDVTAYSDERLKENVEVIDGALAKVKQVRGVTFDRKDGNEERSTGVIAQELIKVLPEAVKEDDNGMLNVAYGNVVGLLIEAVKELSAKVEAQAVEIQELKNK